MSQEILFPVTPSLFLFPRKYNNVAYCNSATKFPKAGNFGAATEFPKK